MTNQEDCSVNLYAYEIQNTDEVVYSIKNLTVEEMDALRLDPGNIMDAQDAFMWAEDVQIMLDDMLTMFPGSTQSQSLDNLIAMLLEMKGRIEGYEVSPTVLEQLLYRNFNMYDLNVSKK